MLLCQHRDLSRNYFSGSIPTSFARLPLVNLSLVGNRINGSIPKEIGDIPTLERLVLEDNQLEGPLPQNLGNLSLLWALHLSGNNFTGTIPDSFGNLKNLTEFRIDGSSLSGIIPPLIGNWTKMERLYMQGTSMDGPIPSTISLLKNITELYISDLNETSMIFPDLRELKQLKRLILRNCLIAGPIPPYIGELTALKILDLSFNMLTGEIPQISEFEYLSTGLFTFNNDGASYKANNTFALNVNGEEFYQTARLAPNSLKYYGLCLRGGSYKVRLHFAEIMYSDDQTFSSLGKRLFDVSIQGIEVLKDFNIMEEAKGAGKGIFKDFNNVTVNGSTLEIHLYWSGKGTNSIPDSGVYGPLISAISVTPNYDPHTGLSVGAIAGIVVASCLFFLLILVVLRMKGYLGGKDLEDK
ncbi:hypothetical protein C3L33_11412, partial [Rhododendron williamsianum]